MSQEIISGNFCKFRVHVIFKSILDGSLPLDTLAKTLICTCNHTGEHGVLCRSLYNKKAIRFSLHDIRTFLDTKFMYMLRSKRRRLLLEGFRLAMRLDRQYEHTWILAFPLHVVKILRLTTFVNNHILKHLRCATDPLVAQAYFMIGTHHRDLRALTIKRPINPQNMDVTEDVWWYKSYINGQSCWPNKTGTLYTWYKKHVYEILQHVGHLPPELIEHIWTFMIARAP